MPTARLALGGTQSSGSSALVIDASNAIDPSSAARFMVAARSQEGARKVRYLLGHPVKSGQSKAKRDAQYLAPHDTAQPPAGTRTPVERLARLQSRPDKTPLLHITTGSAHSRAKNAVATE